jgi:hypothetical protein
VPANDKVWSVADVIDFDAALDTVDSGSATNDRAVFVNRIVPELGGRAGDRRAVFLAWLKARRAQGLPPVGRAYERVIRLVLPFTRKYPHHPKSSLEGRVLRTAIAVLNSLAT